MDTAVCDSFHWEANGLTYRLSTQDSTLLRNSAGCDSTAVLQLRVYESDQTTLRDTMCESSDFWFHGRQCDGGGEFRFDTVNAYGCDSTVWLELEAVTPPALSIGFEADCQSISYRLMAQTTAPTIRWRLTEGEDWNHANEYAVVVGAADEVSCWLLADWRDTLFCPAYDSIRLAPVAAPKAAIELRPHSLDNEHLTLTALSVGKGDIWRQWTVNGASLPDTGRRIVYTANPLADTVWVMLVAGNTTCTDTATAFAPIYRPHLFVPNVFFPAMTEESLGRFCVSATSDVLWYEMTVYDRAGRKVFAGTQADHGWDGTANGRPCAQGTYVYYIRFATSAIPEGVQTKTGTVTLCR